jgi:hypothetical protein
MINRIYFSQTWKAQVDNVVGEQRRNFVRLYSHQRTQKIGWMSNIHSFRRALATSLYFDMSKVIIKMLRLYLSYMLISKELEQKSKQTRHRIIGLSKSVSALLN